MTIDETPNEDSNEDLGSEEAPEEEAGQEQQDETEEAGGAEGTPGEDDNEGDDAGFTVSIGEPTEEEETPPSDDVARPWVKKLRKKADSDSRTIRELKQENKKLRAAHPVDAVEQLGAKPTLESCDYDETSLESELQSWLGRKRKQDDRVQQENEQEKTQAKAWNDSLASYNQKSVELSAKVANFEDSQLAVTSELDQTQQGIIVHAAANSALLVHALGSDPKELKRLAAIKDPVRFAFAISKVEDKVKMSPRKRGPATGPEKKVTGGSGAGSGSVDKELERLDAEADRTGNRTKINAYKRQLRRAKNG